MREKIFAVVVLHPSFVFCIVNISLLELYSSLTQGLRCKREIVEARFLNYQTRLENKPSERENNNIFSVFHSGSVFSLFFGVYCLSMFL